MSLGKTMAGKQDVFQVADLTRVETLAGMPLASFSSRAIAFIIDFAIAAVLFILLAVGTGKLAERLSILPSEENLQLQFTFFKNWYSVLWLVIYFTMSLYLGKGRTIGKKMCRIRVVSLVHEHLSLWHAFERSLGYGASALEAGFGFLQYFLRPDRRTIHDRIAETIVVFEPGKRKI